LINICHDNGIVFVADEIQTGMGRTGKMFAMEHWGVEPDLVTVAKSLAAGMPLSAVVGKKEMLDAPHVGGLGGTYGGNPVACRAGLAVMEIFEEENLLQKAEVLGKKLKERFDAWQQEETKEPAADQAKALVKFCYTKGLILLSCGSFGNVIRTLMPLVITDEQLERGFAIMEEGLAEISTQHS